MSDWLGVDDVIEVFQEVGVQMVVLSGQRVEVNDHIFLNCDVIHHMDEIQKCLQTKTQYKSAYTFTVLLSSDYSSTFLYEFQSRLISFGGHLFYNCASNFCKCVLFLCLRYPRMPSGNRLGFWQKHPVGL